MLSRIGCWRRRRIRASPFRTLPTAQRHSFPPRPHRHVQLQARRPRAHRRAHRHLFRCARVRSARRGRNAQPRHRRLRQCDSQRCYRKCRVVHWETCASGSPASVWRRVLHPVGGTLKVARFPSRT